MTCYFYSDLYFVKNQQISVIEWHKKSDSVLSRIHTDCVMSFQSSFRLNRVPRAIEI